VADVGNDDPSFGVKKLVIFKIGSDKDIGPRAIALFKRKLPAPAAKQPLLK
jgi:hypothetical protein